MQNPRARLTVGRTQSFERYRDASGATSQDHSKGISTEYNKSTKYTVEDTNEPLKAYRQENTSVKDSENSAKLEVSSEEVVVVPKTDLPKWQQENGTFIQKGHRRVTPSIAGCVRSLLYLHNETVNIFSHLLGALLFLNLPFALTALCKAYSTWPICDMVAISIFLYGVGICFALSAMFHTFASHSYKGYNLTRQLDFQGIIILVMSTSSPQVYYTFYDDPLLQKAYWSFIASFGVMASLVSFFPVFKHSTGSPFRVIIFAGMGLSTFAPIIHGIIKHGVQGQSERFPLWTIAMTHMFNVFGAVVYVMHFPERYWPGVFDIWGSSHQLMHCAIVAAALTLLTGTFVAFDNVNHVLSEG